MSLESSVSTARDLTTIAAIIYLGVRCRPLFSAAKTFFSRALDHFTFMETKVDLATNNHLKHIQSSLEALVKEAEKK